MKYSYMYIFIDKVQRFLIFICEYIFEKVFCRNNETWDFEATLISIYFCITYYNTLAVCDEFGRIFFLFPPNPIHYLDLWTAKGFCFLIKWMLGNWEGKKAILNVFILPIIFPLLLLYKRNPTHYYTSNITQHI